LTEANNAADTELQAAVVVSLLHASTSTRQGQNTSHVGMKQDMAHASSGQQQSNNVTATATSHLSRQAFVKGHQLNTCACKDTCRCTSTAGHHRPTTSTKSEGGRGFNI
jgi:hypothetical protein